MMQDSRTWTKWSEWISMLFSVYVFLLVGGFASGTLLGRRQADDIPDDSDDPDASDLLTSIAATAPAPTGAIEPNATTNATVASNGTVKASHVSSALAVATTASSPLNNTNDPHMCHIEHTTDPEGNRHVPNPFCQPHDGQQVHPNTQYQVTWDSALFDDAANNTVQVYPAHNTGLNSPGTADVLISLNATNSQGSVFLNMSSLWLKGQHAANLTLNLIVDQQDKDPSTFDGPIFTLLSTTTSEQPSHSTPSSAPSSSNKLGEKVGLPIGLVFLIIAAIAVALFVCFRRRRAKGYGSGKSLRQRINSGTGRGHRRDASFHDEPTGGVELRDRNRGLTGETPEDNWDWGSPVSSPTSAGGGGGAGGSVNAFRDEIQRQRGGR